MSGIGVACIACAGAIAGLLAWGLVPSQRALAAAAAAGLVVVVALVARRLAERDEESEPEIRAPFVRSDSFPPASAPRGSKPDGQED